MPESGGGESGRGLTRRRFLIGAAAAGAGVALGGVADLKILRNLLTKKQGFLSKILFSNHLSR